MVFSLFKIMLTISCPTSVTLRDLSVTKNVFKHNFLSWLIEIDLFQHAYALNNGLDKVLSGMHKSLVIETLYKEKKRKFYKCKESIKLHTKSYK